jgi:hypothetical protein
MAWADKIMGPELYSFRRLRVLRCWFESERQARVERLAMRSFGHPNERDLGEIPFIENAARSMNRRMPRSSECWDWPRKWRKRGPNVTIGISHGILPVLAEEVAQEWTGRYNPRSVSEMELSTQRGGELEYSDA